MKNRKTPEHKSRERTALFSQNPFGSVKNSQFCSRGIKFENNLFSYWHLSQKGMVLNMVFFGHDKRLSENENEKFTVLYETNKNALTYIALKFIKDIELANDAVSETFLAALKNKKEILAKSSLNFSKWAVVTVKNKCRDIKRRRKKIDLTISLDETQSGEIASKDEPLDLYVIRREGAKLLTDCLNELDPDIRLILEMKYYYDMTYDEISKKTGLTVWQVKGRSERARAKLKQLLAQRGVSRNG